MNALNPHCRRIHFAEMLCDRRQDLVRKYLDRHRVRCHSHVLVESGTAFTAEGWSTIDVDTAIKPSPAKI